MARTLDADYLVIGAGAAALAFVDTLIDHADVRVVMVDRRHAAGGMAGRLPVCAPAPGLPFYGVASTVLGWGQVQQTGPEKGLHERAPAAEVCAYFQHVLDRLTTREGRLPPNCEYLGERVFESRLTGRRTQLAPGCRIVNAHYISPDIPATTGPHSLSRTGRA